MHEGEGRGARIGGLAGLRGRVELSDLVDGESDALGVYPAVGAGHEVAGDVLA
ncbi:hypothetical protein [Saccharopolyspora pogona]|uniref:hypothetical protein n=1 Tax=Saccharopolyspora pogona TaxID=333966 RepID=UPI00168653D7|nr:hypothetical protein [Saccharopolyspora pogona]